MFRIPTALLRSFAGIALVLMGSTASAVVTTWQPANSSELTTALANCNLGDTIILNAANTYVGSFTLRNITTPPDGDGWVTIRSSAIASLPAAGNRVFPTHAGDMPNIQNSISAPAIKTAASAHHYKLIGLELIAPSNNSDVSSAILMLGDPTSAQNSATLVPNNITVDRCIFRANTPDQDIQRVISLHSASTDIINCHIKDAKFHGIEAQCIGGWNGPGPYNIVNNYLEGAGEHIMFGGATVHVPNSVPSDILVSKNHFYIPLAWQGQTDSPNWSVKNHFELKSGRRVTIDGNVFENCFHDAGNQNGASLVFKTIRHSGQGNSWTVTEDITVTRNIIKNVGIGVVIAGSTDVSGPTVPLNGFPRNMTFKDNIFHNINQTYTGNVGRWLYLSNAAPNVTFDHNTAFHTHSITAVWGPVLPNFTFKNNLLNQGNGYGWKGDGTGDGETTLATYFNVGLTWQKNVIMGGWTTNYDANDEYKGLWHLAPFNNAALAFATSNVVQNEASPGTDFAGYKVVGWNQPTNTSTYPYNNTGTDGKDIGADIDAVNAATAGCVSGVWTSTQVTRTLKNGVNGYTGATSFHVSGQLPTQHFGAARYYHVVNEKPGAHGYVYRPFYKFDLAQGANAIPAGAIIDSATLKIRVEAQTGGAANGLIRAYRVKPLNGFTVGYTTGTRNTYNGSSAWSGGANSGGDPVVLPNPDTNDFVDSPHAEVTATAGTVANFNVTAHVQAWVNGETNQGWLFITNGGTYNLSTPADSNGATQFPELTITYH